MPTTYHLEFGRVGRDSRPVPPLTVTADDDAKLCRAVAAHAMPHLQADLAAAGYPNAAKNGRFELAADRESGHFVWLDLAAERGARFCGARITAENGVTPEAGLEAAR